MILAASVLVILAVTRFFPAWFVGPQASEGPVSAGAGTPGGTPAGTASPGEPDAWAAPPATGGEVPSLNEPLPFPADARAVLLMDADTGQILSEDNADEALPLASVTKLMTLRLSLQAVRDGTVSLDKVVTISPHVQADLPPYSSRMFLATGDQVSVNDLLFGAAVPSGNDACIALAELLAGSEADFVKTMNQEAERLGLDSAHFVDSHGYAPGDRMSARDVARLALDYLRVFPEALTYHSAQEFTYGGITQYNHNALLFSYPGCDGLKTGFTSEAGYNLVATATRDGRRLVAVVLGVPSSVRGYWSGSNYRDRLTSQVLDWGFEAFARVEPLSPATAAASLEVFMGASRQVAAVLGGSAAATVPLGREKDVSVSVRLDRPYLVAPVVKGQKLGSALVSVAGTAIREVDVVAAQDVGRGGLLRHIWDSLRLAFGAGQR